MSRSTPQPPRSSLHSRRTPVVSPCASRTTGGAFAPNSAASEVLASGLCASVRKQSAARAGWRARRGAGRTSRYGCLADKRPKDTEPPQWHDPEGLSCPNDECEEAVERTPRERDRRGAAAGQGDGRGRPPTPHRELAHGARGGVRPD